MLALITFFILLLIDPLLALLALLLWLILDSLMSKKTIYYGGKQLVFTRKAVYVNFSLEQRGEYQLYVARGLRILGGEITPSRLIEIAVNVARKVARARGRRKGKGPGRIIDYIIPKARFFKIAIAPTLRRAAISGHWPRVTWEDLREPLEAGRQRASIIVVLDSSASMMHSVSGIVSAFEAIKREACRYRDRISLVVCKGFGAAIVQYPTTNFNLLISKLSNVGLDDFTPLASGMYKGYLLALREKKRGYSPVMVIISDGNVNVPLPRRVGTRFYSIDPAVQSVFEVAECIVKEGIETVVVNTRHKEPMYESVGHALTGTEVLIRLARMTRGSYVGVA